MDIRIKTTDYEMEADVAPYLAKKLASIEKLIGAEAKLTRCEVEIGRDAGKKHKSDYMWYADIRITTPGSPQVYARNKAASVKAAIDDVKEEIGTQLRKVKTKGLTAVRKTGALAKKRLRGS